MTEPIAPPAFPPAPVELAPEIPAKFQNPDGSLNQSALLKSYTEQERLVSQAQRAPVTPPVATPPVAQPAVPAAPAAPNSIEEVVERAGLNWGVVSEQFSQTGDLNEASYQAIEKTGIGRGAIKQTLSALKASREVADAEQRVLGAEVFGSAEQLNVALQSGASLPSSQRQAYNALIADPNTRKQAFEFLKSAVAANVGQPNAAPHVVGNQPAQAPGAQPFRTQADYARAYAYCKKHGAANYDHNLATQYAARINATDTNTLGK